jgi:hypothetical protein
MRITKKHYLAFILLSFFSLVQVVLFNPLLVSAQSQAASPLLQGQVGINDVGKIVYGDNGSGPADIRYTVARIINIVLGFLGVIFFALTIFAGFQYMTSAGNEEQTKKALALLKNAIIGLIIILMSWAITRYVLIISGRAVNNSVDYRTYRDY